MEYVALNSLKSNRSKENSVVQLKTLINYLNNVDAASLNVVSVMGNIVPKNYMMIIRRQFLNYMNSSIYLNQI